MSSWKSRTRREAGAREGEGGGGQASRLLLLPFLPQEWGRLPSKMRGHRGWGQGSVHLCVQGKVPLARNPGIQDRREVGFGVAHTEMLSSATSRFQRSQG